MEFISREVVVGLVIVLVVVLCAWKGGLRISVVKTGWKVTLECGEAVRDAAGKGEDLPSRTHISKKDKLLANKTAKTETKP